MAIELPKISIVTPSYNQASFLEQTIQSVLDQNYPNLEYIIVDGGSTDGSVEIIKKYADRLTWWVSEKDRGQTHAINKGFAHATGDICAYINSDDWYLPGAFQAAVGCFMQNQDAGIVAGRCRSTDAAGVPWRVWSPGIRTLEDILDVAGAWERGYFAQPAVFWTREAMKKAGELDESQHLVMDYDYWIRLLMAGAKIRLLDQDLACFRLHAAQKSGMAQKMAMDTRRVAQKYLWNPNAPLGRPARWRLQALWLYDGPYRQLMADCVAKGEGRLLRWGRLACFLARHPVILNAVEVRRQLPLFGRMWR